MRAQIKYLFLVFAIVMPGYNKCCAQQNNIDSLFILLKKSKLDSNKADILIKLADIYSYQNPDSAIYFATRAKNIAKKINDKKRVASALKELGWGNTVKGNYPKALEYYFSALKIYEALQNKSGIENCLGNIGNVYANLDDYPKALGYYFKALKIVKELKDKNGIAATLGNIGFVYWNQGNYPKALDFYLRALKLDEELGDKNGIATDLGNIGIVYAKQGDHPKALDCFFKALKVAEELGDKTRVVIWLSNIGTLFIEIKKYAEAEKYLLDATKPDNEIGDKNIERQVEELLSRLYQNTNRYQLALKHYKNAMALKDSIFSEEKNKEITRKEMNYEFEKKEAAAKALQDKKDALAKEELKQKEQQRNYFIVGFVLVFLLALFILRGFRQKQKANILIFAQKEEVVKKNHIIEEKQKEIIDSIRYARRIQQALLPSERYIKTVLNSLKNE